MLMFFLILITSPLLLAEPGSKIRNPNSPSWPDYQHSKEYENLGADSYFVVVANEKFSNSYINRIEINVGTETVYSNRDAERNTLITDYNILGKGVVVRKIEKWSMFYEWELYDMQILVRGVWISLGPNSRLIIYLLNEEVFFKENRLTKIGVEVRSNWGSQVITVQ